MFGWTGVSEMWKDDDGNIPQLVRDEEVEKDFGENVRTLRVCQ